jgi:hypothetical protein
VRVDAAPTAAVCLAAVRVGVVRVDAVALLLRCGVAVYDCRKASNSRQWEGKVCAMQYAGMAAVVLECLLKLMVWCSSLLCSI